MTRLLVAVVAFVLGILAGASGDAQALSSPMSAHDVIVKLLDRNPSLTSYASRVHVDLRMLNFPFLSPKLDGTSYYKRPNNYEVVFDRVPAYAHGFDRLFDEIADPVAWEKYNNVKLLGTQQLYGRPMLVLSMTKKIHSTILDHTLAYVDPTDDEILQMEWHYTSGGLIVMRQWYRDQGPYRVVSQQHVEINIPHVHAVGDSQYGVYQTNIALDDSVFMKR